MHRRNRLRDFVSGVSAQERFDMFERGNMTMSIENAYRILFLGALIWFCLMILVMLIRAITGPRVTDRILSINMIGSMVISSICILSFLLDESYLLDVALLYAMISFVAVLILSSTYIPKDPTRRKYMSKDEKPGIKGMMMDMRSRDTQIPDGIVGGKDGEEV